MNENNAAIRRGCEALGYNWSITERNSRGCDCEQCGYCTFGCRVGGKQSTVATYLHVMQRWRASMVITGCRAEQVMFEGSRVSGVAASTLAPDGVREQVIIRAPVVVVCAGGIESAALLQRSGAEPPRSSDAICTCIPRQPSPASTPTDRAVAWATANDHERVSSSASMATSAFASKRRRCTRGCWRSPPHGRTHDLIVA